MARKTKREKQTIDMRNLYTFQAKDSFPQAAESRIRILQTTELTKTFAVTLLILAFQIALFIGFKKQLISIPGITY